MKLQKLSMLTLSMIAASALLASTASLAANYKGDFKGEGAIPAAPCPQEKGLSDGFYLGVGVGYDSYRMRQNVNLTDSVGNNMNQNPALNATGWMGGLFGGYGQYMTNSNIYLGGELFANLSNASTTQTVTGSAAGGGAANYYTNTSGNGSYGISFIPGVKITNNTLLYVRGGYIRTKFEVKESTSTGFSSSNNNWQNGWNYGVGLESAIYDNWSVRTEYTHANFSSYTISASGTKVTPSDNQVMLGLLYHFT